MLNKEEIEKYKTDTDSLDLTNKEIINEAMATLNNSINIADDGFRRIEKISLLAIDILLKYIEQLESKANKYDSLVKKIKDKIERTNKLLDNGKYAKYGMNPYELEAQKEILQELLKEEEE